MMTVKSRRVRARTKALASQHEPPRPHPSSTRMPISLRLVLLALSAATGAQGACARNATVQSPGETCDVISNLFNASTSVHPTPRHQIPCS